MEDVVSSPQIYKSKSEIDLAPQWRRPERAFIFRLTFNHHCHQQLEQNTFTHILAVRLHCKC